MFGTSGLCFDLYPFKGSRIALESEPTMSSHHSYACNSSFGILPSPHYIFWKFPSMLLAISRCNTVFAVSGTKECDSRWHIALLHKSKTYAHKLRVNGLHSCFTWPPLKSFKYWLYKFAFLCSVLGLGSGLSLSHVVLICFMVLEKL